MSDSGGHLEQVCPGCPAGKHQPSEWVDHIDKLYTLQQGGFPFQAEDLTIEEWRDLGTYRSHIESIRASHGL